MKTVHALSIAVLVVLHAMAAEPQARIKIDTDRGIGEVHPHPLRQLRRASGPLIYGGIYEEGSPLSDRTATAPT